MTGGSPPSVWALRAAVWLGVVAGLFAGVTEGYTPPVAVVVVVVLGSLASAFRPEHLSLTLTTGLVVVWWALQLRGGMPAVVLVVAAFLTAAHVAAVLLSYGPPTLPLDRGLGLLWLGRAAVAWLGALLVWAVGRSYTGHGTPELFWLGGLAAAVVAAVAAGASLAPRRESSET